MKRPILRWLWLVGLWWPLAGYSATPEFVIEIKEHLFFPDALTVPAYTKFKLVIYNRDETPEEFESYEFNREKVIGGGRKAVIFVGPLDPGEYPFFGEFNPKTAQGRLRVVEPGAPDDVD